MKYEFEAWEVPGRTEEQKAADRAFSHGFIIGISIPILIGFCVFCHVLIRSGR